MKQVTYQDIWDIIASYNARNKRFIGKQKYIALLEKKIHSFDKNAVISQAMFESLYAFVTYVNVRTKNKLKKRKIDNTASSVAFDRLISLLVESKQCLDSYSHDLSKNLEVRYPQHTYYSAYCLQQISDTLLETGTASVGYINLLRNKISNLNDPIQYLYELTCYLYNFEPIIKALHRNNESHSPLFMAKLFNFNSVDQANLCCQFLLLALVPCLEQSYGSDFRMSVSDNLLKKQAWYRTHLEDLVSQDEEAVIKLIHAVNAADTDTLKVFCRAFSSGEGIDAERIDYSFAALTSALNAKKLPDQPFNKIRMSYA